MPIKYAHPNSILLKVRILELVRVSVSYKDVVPEPGKQTVLYES